MTLKDQKTHYLKQTQEKCLHVTEFLVYDVKRFVQQINHGILED